MIRQLLVLSALASCGVVSAQEFTVESDTDASISVEEWRALKTCSEREGLNDFDRLIIQEMWLRGVEVHKCPEYEFWKAFREYLQTCSFVPNTTSHRCEEILQWAATKREELNLDEE